MTINIASWLGSPEKLTPTEELNARMSLKRWPQNAHPQGPAVSGKGRRIENCGLKQTTAVDKGAQSTGDWGQC